MKEFTRVEPTTVYEVGDKYKKAVVVKRYSTDDGLMHEFTTFNNEQRQAAAVIALTKDAQVVISRQFRPGREAWLDEIPGGGFEEGETAEEAASRELFEETGYRPGTLRYLGAYSWDAYNNLTSHYFLATDCTPEARTTPEQVELDQGLEVVLISIQELIDNAKKDKMTDAAAVLMAYEDLKGMEG